MYIRKVKKSESKSQLMIDSLFQYASYVYP